MHVTRLWLVCALLALGALAGCGSKAKDAAKSTSTASPQASPSSGKPAANAVPVVGVRVIDRSASKPAAFASTATVKGPATAQVQVRAPSSVKQPAPIVGIKPGAGKLTITAQPKPGAPKKTAVLDLTDSKLTLGRVVYACRLGADSFCPVRTKKTGGRTELRMAKGKAPVVLNLLLEHKGATKPTRLATLGAASAGSPVRAAVALVSVPADKGKPSPASTQVTAAADGRVVVYVRPAQDSPSRGTLRIAIPRTRGKSIEVQAGGDASNPTSRATIRAKSGRVQVAEVDYNCLLPPATFCPVRTRKSAKRFLVLLKTPRVPVRLVLRLAGG
jgi:hypothetical protein